MANQLLDKEVLLKSDVERLIGKRPFAEVEKAPLKEKVSSDNGTLESTEETTIPSEE